VNWTVKTHTDLCRWVHRHWQTCDVAAHTAGPQHDACQNTSGNEWSRSHYV